MSGKEYRQNEFIRPDNGRSLLLDASAGLSLGPLPGLEHFTESVDPVLSLVDGIVCSPGFMRKLNTRTRLSAGVLVRMDWTNTIRPQEFILPTAKTKHISLLNAQDALDLGAAGMVFTFLLGYEEEVEAACLYQTVQLALEGRSLGIPLVVEVRTSGPRVSIPDKAVELGVSYALEGGADAVVFPYPGRKSLTTIASFSGIPWLIRASSIEKAHAELEDALEFGGAGLMLDHRLFQTAEPAGLLSQFNSRLHDLVAE
jgi:DhnA family fructose-bisphosphate aldolase class Ia